MNDIIGFVLVGIAVGAVIGAVVGWRKASEARREKWRRVYTGLFLGIGTLILVSTLANHFADSDRPSASQRAEFDRGYMKSCVVPPLTEQTCRCALGHLVATLGRAEMTRRAQADPKSIRLPAREAIALCEDTEPGAYQAVLAFREHRCERNASKAECACYYRKLAKRWPTAMSEVVDATTTAEQKALATRMATSCGLKLTFPARPAKGPAKPAPKPRPKPTPIHASAATGTVRSPPR